MGSTVDSHNTVPHNLQNMQVSEGKQRKPLSKKAHSHIYTPQFKIIVLNFFSIFSLGWIKVTDNSEAKVLASKERIKVLGINF